MPHLLDVICVSSCKKKQQQKNKWRSRIHSRSRWSSLDLLFRKDSRQIFQRTQLQQLHYVAPPELTPPPLFLFAWLLINFLIAKRRVVLRGGMINAACRWRKMTLFTFRLVLYNDKDNNQKAAKLPWKRPLAFTAEALWLLMPYSLSEVNHMLLHWCVDWLNIPGGIQFIDSDLSQPKCSWNLASHLFVRQWLPGSWRWHKVSSFFFFFTWVERTIFISGLYVPPEKFVLQSR